MDESKELVCTLAALGFTTKVAKSQMALRTAINEMKNMKSIMETNENFDINEAGKFMSMFYDYKKRLEYVVNDLEDTVFAMDMHCGDTYTGRDEIMEVMEDFRELRADLEGSL